MKRITAKQTVKLYSYLEVQRENITEKANKIKRETNKFLNNQDEENLLNVYELITSEETLQVSQMVGDINKLSKIVGIIYSEHNEGVEFFSKGVCCTEDLLDKYLRTILFLRRIEMCMESKLLDESMDYINENRISNIAVKMILDKEIFSKGENVYQYVQRRRS